MEGAAPAGSRIGSRAESGLVETAELAFMWGEDGQRVLGDYLTQGGVACQKRQGVGIKNGGQALRQYFSQFGGRRCIGTAAGAHDPGLGLSGGGHIGMADQLGEKGSNRVIADEAHHRGRGAHRRGSAEDPRARVRVASGSQGDDPAGVLIRARAGGGIDDGAGAAHRPGAGSAPARKIELTRLPRKGRRNGGFVGDEGRWFIQFSERLSERGRAGQEEIGDHNLSAFGGQRVAKARRAEGDGDIGVDGIRGAHSRVGIDAGRHVDG